MAQNTMPLLCFELNCGSTWVWKVSRIIQRIVYESHAAYLSFDVGHVEGFSRFCLPISTILHFASPSFVSSPMLSLAYHREKSNPGPHPSLDKEGPSNIGPVSNNAMRLAGWKLLPNTYEVADAF
jgi:hypothetical protein